MKKISIIIPTYNVEQYIQSTLNSIFSQSFDKNLIEVIVIDDNSTDNTLKIIKSYKYPIIIKTTKKNSGPGIARNIGINIAKGEYILFVDGDDELAPNSLKKLLNSINKKYDIVRFNSAFLTTPNIRNKKDLNVELNDKIYFIKLYLGMNMDGSVTRTLIKKEILLKNKIFFNKGFYEDIPIILQIYYYAKKIKIFDEIIYLVRKRKGSITQTISKKHILDYFRRWDECVTFVINNTNLTFSDIESYFKRGINGLVYTKINEILNKESKNKKRLLLLNYIHEALIKSKYLDIIDMPNETFKDKIANLFYKNSIYQFLRGINDQLQ